MKRRDIIPALAGLSLLNARQLAAQAPPSPVWAPDRPIRFIVGFAPGGSTDTTARVIGQGISAGLGQPVVIENRTGAAGNIATEHVARSAPDGHTLVVASMGSQATNAALYNNLSFDPVKDFTPVTLMVLSACLVVVHPSLPIHNITDLIAYARANPEKLNCGIAGAGSSQHFAASLFEHQANIRFTQISYRGGAPAMADLVSGRIAVMFTPVVEAIEQMRAGQVRAIGITRSTRSPQLPDIPSVAEGLPGYLFNSWLGLFAPAGTASAAVQRISQEVAKALREGETRQRMEQLGYEPVGSTPEEFARFFAAEMPRVAELVRISGAKVE